MAPETKEASGGAFFGGISIDDVNRFADAVKDLLNPEVMADAWQQTERTFLANQQRVWRSVRRSWGVPKPFLPSK